MTIKYNWTPRVGVGPIRFGNPIAGYVAAGQLVLDEDEKKITGDLDYYDPDVGMIVTPDQESGETVFLIGCGDSLLYQGEELIGISLPEAAKILDRSPDGQIAGEEVEEYDVDEIVYFMTLGLDLWFVDGLSVYARTNAFDGFEEDDGDDEEDGDVAEPDSGQAGNT